MVQSPSPSLCDDVQPADDAQSTLSFDSRSSASSSSSMGSPMPVSPLSGNDTSSVVSRVDLVDLPMTPSLDSGLYSNSCATWMCVFDLDGEEKKEEDIRDGKSRPPMPESWGSFYSGLVPRVTQWFHEPSCGERSWRGHQPLADPERRATSMKRSLPQGIAVPASGFGPGVQLFHDYASDGCVEMIAQERVCS